MVRGINPLKDIVSVLKMVFLLSRERPLAVHSYTPKAGLVTMLAAWICRVPVRIHTFTGLIFPTQKGFKKSLLIWIDRLICACATRVVPEGEGVKKDLVQYKITRRPLSVIGHGNIAGVDVSFFDPGSLSLAESSSTLKSSLNITSGDVVYCFVGRLNKDKGLKELALAFSALPAHAHLIIVGDMDDSAPIDGASMNFFSPIQEFICWVFNRISALPCSALIFWYFPVIVKAFPMSYCKAVRWGFLYRDGH